MKLPDISSEIKEYYYIFECWSDSTNDVGINLYKNGISYNIRVMDNNDLYGDKSPIIIYTAKMTGQDVLWLKLLFQDIKITKIKTPEISLQNSNSEIGISELEI